MTTALESQSLTAAGVYDLLFAAPSKAAAEPPPVNTPQPPPGKARAANPADMYSLLFAPQHAPPSSASTALSAAPTQFASSACTSRAGSVPPTPGEKAPKLAAPLQAWAESTNDAPPPPPPPASGLGSASVTGGSFVGVRMLRDGKEQVGARPQEDFLTAQFRKKAEAENAQRTAAAQARAAAEAQARAHEEARQRAKEREVNSHAQFAAQFAAQFCAISRPTHPVVRRWRRSGGCARRRRRASRSSGSSKSSRNGRSGSERSGRRKRASGRGC